MFSGYPEILSLHLLAIFITSSKSSLGICMLFSFGVNDFFYLKFVVFGVFLLQKVGFIA